jgi:peptide/nickel transport system substrate-binding protein
MRSVALATAIVLVSAITACRNPEGSGSTAAARRQRVASATISDPKTFNPLLVVDSASATVVGASFEGLVRLNPKTTEMEPALADRWEANDSGAVYTFHLRHGVLWHDGVSFTAGDVAFTFAAIYDDRVPNSSKPALLVTASPSKRRSSMITLFASSCRGRSRP